PDAGQIQVNKVLLGTYTITETVAPAGFALDDDPTRVIVVTNSEPNPVVGTQAVNDLGNTDESDFHDPVVAQLLVLGADAGANTGPWVQVIDKSANKELFKFEA